MDSTDEITNNDEITYDDEIEKRVRTLWVGNLHPKVSNRDIAELFYQVGPIEYVEFTFDEHDICENFALVVFKYPSSVEDSIKLFRGTELYGLPIVTKNYSKHFEDPAFNDQLNYFKQLIKVERNCQLKNSPDESKWMDQSLDEKNIIPDTLPEPPMHDVHSLNKNQDNYNHRSVNMARCNSKVKRPKFNHGVSHLRGHNSVNSGEHYPIDKSHHSHKHHKKSEHNSSSGSMNVFNYDQDSYNNQNNARNQHDNVNSSFNRKESTYHNPDPSLTHEKSAAKKNMLVRDLRDTMFRKRNRLDSNFHIDTNANAGCTSLLDLRDTMYHNKNSRHEDLGQQHYESDFNNRWSERNQNTRSSSSFSNNEPHQNTGSNSSFSNNEPRKNNFNSERYSESNTKHQNHYADQSYNHDNTHNGFQEYDSKFPNNYNNGYRREQNRPINQKYNNNPQNMESSSRQHNSYHPYKRNNEGQDRKNYKNLYDGQSGQNRDRGYNGGGTDGSKHSYYS